jgi:hypothetical protein
VVHALHASSPLTVQARASGEFKGGVLPFFSRNKNSKTASSPPTAQARASGEFQGGFGW